MNLEHREAMAKLFNDHQFVGVVNLAAQRLDRYLCGCRRLGETIWVQAKYEHQAWRREFYSLV